MPGQKLFALEDIQRIPVQVSPEAHTALICSSHEGRKFAQALSELFGALGCVREVHVTLVEKRRLFPTEIHEAHSLLLRVEVIHARSQVPRYHWYINLSDFQHVPAHRSGGLQAAVCVQELVRLYPYGL